MTTKYYRIIKDHPLWEVGAILSNEGHSGGTYSPIEDIWSKIEGCDDYTDGKTMVENQPEFYERVYKDRLDKMIFYTKTEMKKVYEKFKK
jgi:hypothetical protein